MRGIGKTIRVMTAALAACLCSGALCAGAAAPAASEIKVSAEAAVLMDAGTGRVLFAENAEKPLAVASTTKIMTALLACESGRLDDTVTITDEMARVEGTSMGLCVGNEITLKGLVVGMLLASGNDAANAVAISLGGSQPGFAALMNKRASELGMAHTHFVTPSGLDDADHYSTAHDMAVLARAAMGNPTFASIVGSQSAVVTFGLPPVNHSYHNHNRLLWTYDGADGVKTGFTHKAGRCLVSSAARDGIELIAVTLDAPDDWDDHKAMLDYGFGSLRIYTPVLGIEDKSMPVAGGAAPSVGFAAKVPGIALTEEEATRLKRDITLKQFVFAPVKKGDVLGSIAYSLDGQVLARVDITAAADVPAVVRPAAAEGARFWYWLRVCLKL